MERQEFKASSSKLEHEICRRCEECRISVGERQANQLKINEIREGGKFVWKIEMGDPRFGQLVKKNEMDVPKVEKVGVGGKLVKRNETGGPRGRKY